MNTMIRWMVYVLVCGMGLSFTLAGCKSDSPSVPQVVTPTPGPVVIPTPVPNPVIQAEPTATPVPQPATLLDTTVSLNANARCRDGDNFCADNLTFMPAQVGKSVTVRVTAPSNLDPDVTIVNSAEVRVAGGYSYTFGLEVVTFTPYQLDVFRVRINDYRMVGGAVHVVATQ